MIEAVNWKEPHVIVSTRRATVIYFIFGHHISILVPVRDRSSFVAYSLQLDYTYSSCTLVRLADSIIAMCAPPVTNATTAPKSHGKSSTGSIGLGGYLNLNLNCSRRTQQRVQSFLLDFSTAALVLRHLHRNPSYINPWDLSALQWTAGFVFIRCAITFYDHLVTFLIETCLGVEVLPTRRKGAPPVRCVELDTQSIIYLTINSFNEFVFVQRLTRYLWFGGFQGMLPWKLGGGLDPLNTLVALGLIFVWMDALYAPLHHMLHMPRLYPLIHKHHHRQHFPARGYLDAGNEHPIEHAIGVGCIWFAVCTTEVLIPTCRLWIERIMSQGLGACWDALQNGSTEAMVRGGGVHALTVLIFFNFHAALAMLNHSPYDVRFSMPVPGVGKFGRWFGYSVGYHEMHHRKFNYNYGQYCMWYDKFVARTFMDYEGPVSVAPLESKKKR